MQTYKEVVAKFKEKNSKTPKTTWRYESWGDSYEQGGRVGYDNGGPVGNPTGMITEYGRKVYETPGGEKVSEKSVTLQMGDTWINVPSIHGGKMYNQAQLEQMLMSGKIQPSSVHNSEQEAVNAAMSRSDTMQSGRVGYQSGQLVQPGPGRQGYAGPIKTVRQGLGGYRVTVQRKTDEGVKAIDQFFSTKKYGSLNKAKEAAQGVYSQFITDNPFLSNEEFSNLYKTFEGTDKEFANFLDTEGYKAKGNKIFDENSVFKRRATLGLETNNPKPTIKDFKKEAKALGIDIKGLDDQTIKNKVRDKRGDIIKKERRLTDPDFVAKERATQKAWQEANPEKYKEAQFQARVKSYEKIGMIQPVKNAKEELWRSLFEDGKKYQKGRRLKMVGNYGRYVSREKFLDAEILDTKTNKKITFKNLEKYINPKNTGKTYAEVIKPFDQKWFINEQKGLRTEINSKLIPNWTKGDKRNFFEIQHNAGRYTDPFDVSLGTKSTNIGENTARVQFEKRWNKAKTFTDKKNAFKIYKETLPEGILSKPSMVTRSRYFGEEGPLDEQLRTLKKESGVILPRGTLKKAESQFITENLKDFCPKQKVALGGRIGFAGTCTPQQILDNMKKDQQLLIEYKKGTKNISSAEAAKIAQKFTNVSGKISKLGLKGAKFMFGPAMLWGEPLIEGALIAYDMKVEKTPFKQAAAKSFLTAPLRAMNLMKESEEYEAESLFQKKDNREFVYFDGKEIKNPNFGKVTGVIPGVKAYTDARNKLMRINDLRSRMNVMQEEVESGDTLGAADAVEFLRKKLSKELSDIRYDEKSLENIMKKNEPEYNIAVEKLRAKRFKDVDPDVPDEGDPFGTTLDVTRNKRLEAMADVNRGYLQDEGAFGHYVSSENYEQIKNLASQPSNVQEFYQKIKKQIDDMGGPSFEPYKKILKQPGFGGPANRYTYGQMTTPADRYHLDRTGKIAGEGGVANLAAGGRVSFSKGGFTRRGFLKLLAALGIGGATAGTGLIKLGGKVVGKKTAVKVGADIATGTPGMPSWFPSLVNKVIKEGDDVTEKLATMDRQVVHTKKLPDGEEVTVYRNLDSGDIRVDYDSIDNMGQEPVSLQYTKGEEIYSTGKGYSSTRKTTKEPDTFGAAESEPAYIRTGPDDAEVQWQGSEYGTVDDLMSDTSRIKNYAESKKPTIKEIVTRKRKTDEVNKINTDEGVQVDYSVNKYGDGPDPSDYDDYLPDIDDID